MYERHFGLSVSPFAMSPDPRFLFFTPSHREALAGLMYGILNRKGFVSLIGEAGTGKTSLLRRVLQAVGGNKSLIVNPAVSASDFMKIVMVNFGIENVPEGKAEQLALFEKFLRQSNEEGSLCVLVVDEAQRLSPSVLEEIRLLTNFELSDGKLLQIVLAGQGELRDLINRPDLRQLKQRIAMRLNLKPLSGVDDVGTYIRHRWVIAGGGDTSPFSSEATALIARCSTGIPRVVNVLCDNALVLAFAEGTKTVSVEQVRAAAAELDLADWSAPVAANGFNATNGVNGHAAPKLEEARPSLGQNSVSVPPTLERYQPVRNERPRFWKKLFAK